MITYLRLSEGMIEKVKNELVPLVCKTMGNDVKKYNDSLAQISTEFAKKYLAVVNFVCLPEREFEEKKAGILILKT